MITFMRRIRVGQLLAVLACGCLLSACASKSKKGVSSGADLTSAANYLESLMAAGKLPGCKPGERGSLDSVPQPAPEWGAPVLETLMTAQFNDQPGVKFWYRLRRPSYSDPWVLVEAWVADPHGNAQHLPVR